MRRQLHILQEMLLLRDNDSDGLTKGSTDVGVCASDVSRRVVVADSEVLRIGGVGQAVGAVLSGTADLLSALPDNLREVAPRSKVGGIHVVGVVWAGVVGHLTVVHIVANHAWDLERRVTSTDVLTIAATTSGDVVAVDAGCGNLSSNGGQVGGPCQIGSGVVGTVKVVGFENAGDVVGADIDSLDGGGC